jgi:hypothetical protein
MDDCFVEDGHQHEYPQVAMQAIQKRTFFHTFSLCME